MLKFNTDRFLLAEFEDDGVVFSRVTNIPYVINNTGLRILKLCNGKYDKRSIINIISKEYGLERENIKSDINEIITKYRKLNILK